MTRTARPASEKQIAFAQSLGEQVGSETYNSLLMDQGAVSIQDLDVRQASAFITELKKVADEARRARYAQERRERAEKRVVQEAVAAATGLDVGMYMRDGKAIKVYPARNGGHLLAKVLDSSGEWSYLGAASRFVSVENKMTEAQAKEFGDAFGVCVCCGRLLTDEDSVQRGIGPVCAKKYFG